ncbi:unnamed protein product [Parascedosporium putredinis]|uniref:Uncharacterized protein n=1 Tax=Parascedosporium putredinis TaxID=1442378 RepID=A0A9P1HC05_9PEZI|nr:unnamed protein product [Parascedosporium putredinis]CAI8004375.1 unnamed protein product [Parascedosporium putredinis]
MFPRLNTDANITHNSAMVAGVDAVHDIVENRILVGVPHYSFGELLEETISGESLVRLTAGRTVEITSEGDAERTPDTLEMANPGGDELDTLRTRDGALVVEVGVGGDPAHARLLVFEDGNGGDAGVGGIPALEGRSDVSDSHDAQQVNGVQDGAVLSGFEAVVARDADVGPRGAETGLDVKELVVEDFLHADDGDGTRRSASGDVFTTPTRSGDRTAQDSSPGPVTRTAWRML